MNENYPSLRFELADLSIPAVVDSTVACTFGFRVHTQHRKDWFRSRGEQGTIRVRLGSETARIEPTKSVENHAA